MKCPKCSHEFNAGKIMGSVKSERKAIAARKNGMKAKRKPCPIDVIEKEHSKTIVKIWKSWEDQIPRAICQHISGCSNPGFQTKGRLVYLCKEHS